MQSVRHALSAAAVAAVALGGLTACNGLDIAVLQAGARTTGTSPATPSTTAAAAPGPPSASPTVTPTSLLPTSSAAPTTSQRAAIDSTPADTSVAGQIVKLVNSQRSKAGCKKVTLDSKLTAAAAGHARDMAANNFFSHTGTDGSTFAARIKAAGYAAPKSENIAAGQSSGSAVMSAWMKSADHRANILDCSATQMGAASAKGGTYGTYWVQDFGRG